MLISSKFHDYYDTAMTYGIDKECIYNRNTEEKDFKIKLPYRIHDIYVDKNTKADIEPLIIGFCGKIYPCIKISYTAFIGLPLNYTDEFIFDLETARKRLRELGIDLTRKNFWYENYLDSAKGLDNFYNKSYSFLEPAFRESNTPVFLIKIKSAFQVRFIVNPVLKDYKFMKVVDPYSAFQQIYQYLAGVLGNKEVDIVKISDKDMLQQKGFDKYSFKTLKGDKKPRKKNRNKTVGI